MSHEDYDDSQVHNTPFDDAPHDHTKPERESPRQPDAIIDTRLDASAAMMALSRAEIDQQITTAKAYPRSIERFQRDTRSMALLDQETAASMFYALPRGGKTIKGPSVRMAEVVASNWGNLRSGARIVAIDDQFVTAQGCCHDLEKNNYQQYETKRRITDKNGRRYNDDMIQTTCNAACAIALREAVFKVVPRSLFKSIYEQAQKTAVGEVKSIVQKRVDWFAYFAKMGVTKEQVCEALGVAGENDIGTDQLVTMVGMSTSLRDGDSTIEGMFGLRPDQKSKVKPSENADKLKGNGPAKPATNGTNGHADDRREFTRSQEKRQDAQQEQPNEAAPFDTKAETPLMKSENPEALADLGTRLGMQFDLPSVMKLKTEYTAKGLTQQQADDLDLRCSTRIAEIRRADKKKQ